MSRFEPRRPAVLALSAFLALSAPASLRAQDAEAKDADRLVQELGAEDFARRDAAQKKLETLGREAIPALEKAVKESKDAEVRARAQAALEVVRKGAKPPEKPRDKVRGTDRPPGLPIPRPIQPRGEGDEGENEGEGLDLQDIFKLFGENGEPSVPKIFERLRKQVEGADGEPKGNFRVFGFGPGTGRPRGGAETKLGLTLEAPPPALASQLDLPGTDGGLLVAELTPGKPAWKAGLQRYDVVVSIDGRPVRSAQDLAGLGEKDARVEVVRKAKRETLVVHGRGETLPKPEPKPAPAPETQPAPEPKPAPEPDSEGPVRKF